MNVTNSLYDLDQLYDQLKDVSKKVGRVSMRPILSLYYVLKNSDTPSSDKILIVSALSYLVLPIDLISAKRIPIIGWIDEIAAIMLAYNKIKKHITPEIESEVENTLEKWFPKTTYELLP